MREINIGTLHNHSHTPLFEIQGNITKLLKIHNNIAVLFKMFKGRFWQKNKLIRKMAAPTLNFPP